MRDHTTRDEKRALVRAADRAWTGALRLALTASLSLGMTLGTAGLPAAAATLTLSVATQPGDGFPASPLASQPALAFTPATSGANTLSAQLTDSAATPITSTAAAQLSAGGLCPFNKCTVSVPGGATSKAFAGLTIDRVGTYKLVFTLEAGGADTAAVSVTSNSFTVALGVGNQLMLDSTVAGSGRARPLNGQPKVAITDAGLNLITTNSSDTVSLQLLDVATLAPPTNGAILGGTTSATFAQGTATFGGLTISQNGDYVLRASSSAAVASLNIKGPKYSSSLSAADAPVFIRDKQMVIQSGPSSGRAGQVLDPLVVQLTDSNGNLQNTTENIVVHLTRNGVDVPFTFGGATATAATIPLVAGMATISGVIIPTASGAGAYTFVVEAAATNAVNTKAQSGNLGNTAPTAGQPFRLSDRQLLFTVQPSQADAGKPMGRNVVVSLLDGAGNPAPNSTDQVRIFFGASTSAKLSGQGCASDGRACVLTLVNGAAVFASLSADQPGSYTLTATTSAVDSSGGSIPSATSDTFTIAGAGQPTPIPAVPSFALPTVSPSLVEPPPTRTQPEVTAPTSDEETSAGPPRDEAAAADDMAAEASDSSPTDQESEADEAQLDAQ